MIKKIVNNIEYYYPKTLLSYDSTKPEGGKFLASINQLKKETVKGLYLMDKTLFLTQGTKSIVELESNIVSIKKSLSEGIKSQKSFNSILKNTEDGILKTFNAKTYMSFLNVLSKSNQYSLRNLILLYIQNKDVQQVASYNQWKKLGASVLKGDKALKVLAPVIVDESKVTNKQDAIDVIKSEEGKENKVIVGFKYVPTFDISQTTLKDSPELLQGTSTKARIMTKILIDKFKIPVIERQRIKDLSLLKGAKGYFNITYDNITVNKDLSDIQKMKNLVHEYAHHLQHENSLDITKLDVNEVEIEAEASAYMFCKKYGFDTEDYSFTYISSYLAKKDSADLKLLLKNASSLSDKINELIEPEYTLVMKEIEGIRQSILKIEGIESDQINDRSLSEITYLLNNQEEDKGLDYEVIKRKIEAEEEKKPLEIEFFSLKKSCYYRKKEVLKQIEDNDIVINKRLSTDKYMEPNKEMEAEVEMEIIITKH